jgi:hypothetical protein
LTFEDSEMAKKHFTKEKESYLIIGYATFLEGLTEVFTWLLRAMNNILTRITHEHLLKTRW